MSDLEAVRANIESNPDAAHEGLFALLRIRKSRRSTNERHTGISLAARYCSGAQEELGDLVTTMARSQVG